MKNIFKKQNEQIRVDSFKGEFKTLVEKHGLDWGASIIDCPHCKGTGKIVQMQIVDIKK